MTSKKFFTGIPVLILKTSIIVFLSCGLTSCSFLSLLFKNEVANENEVLKLRQQKVEQKKQLERLKQQQRTELLASMDYKEIPFGDLKSNIESITEDGHGFIVKAYVRQVDWWVLYVGDSPNPYKQEGVSLGGAATYKFSDQIEEDRQYEVYVAVLKEDYYGRKSANYSGIATKIEGLRSVQEIAIAQEEKKKADKAAKAAAQEAKSNPNKLDRSQYKTITVEDFSFDMVAGKLPAGSKVAFKAKFFTKPTGTNYSFHDVNMGITISSDHNFVSDMPARYLGSYMGSAGFWVSQYAVTVYVTVKKPGQYGECSVDIIDWNDSPFTW